MTSEMNRSVTGFAVVIALTAAAVGMRATTAAAQNPRRVVLMTQNIYQGTELEHVVSARTPIELVMGVATDYGNVIATDFAQRAEAMANEIAQNPPALVGLQEVALWRVGTPSASFPAPPASDVSYDFLQILIDHLAAHGLRYVPVVTIVNWEAEGTGLFQFGFMDVRLSERSAIIARADVTPDELSTSNPQAAHYADATTIPVLGSSFTLTGSWLSIDAKVRGKTFRFITTHLDPFSPAIRAAQAAEILSGPANVDLPVVIAGDLNSSASTAAYATLTGAGFTDTWLAANADDPGLTCCQVPPDSIRNPISQLTERVDYLLAKGGVLTLEEHLVGADPADRAPSGLWPSDHAGIVATIGIDPLPHANP